MDRSYHNHHYEGEVASEPENEREMEMDEEVEFDDNKSLCHWKENSTNLNSFTHTTFFLENLSKKKRFQAVMLCKKLGVLSLFSNLGVEGYLTEWLVNDSTSEDWQTLFTMILKAGCQKFEISNVDALTYSGIFRSLGGIKFHSLTHLKFDSVFLGSLEIFTYLDAPFLFSINIDQCDLTNTKALHKTNFGKLKYFFVQMRSFTVKNHKIQRFEKMERMRAHTENFTCQHTNANIILLGIYNQASDYSFQLKMESKDVISNMRSTFQQEVYTSMDDDEINCQNKYSLVMEKCLQIFGRYETEEERLNVLF